MNLSGLTSITVKIRTYGGKEYNTLDVYAGEELITTFVTTTGSTLTEYKWTNTGTLSGKTPLTFSCPVAGSKKGIGLSEATIEATGVRILYSDYLTSCSGTEDIENSEVVMPIRKFIRSGELLIQVGEQIYTITGQRVR